MATSVALPARAVIAGKKVRASTRMAVPAARSALKVSAATYKVQPGDTVYKIATLYKVTPMALAESNKVDLKSFIIQPDQVLNIPKSTAVSSTMGAKGGKGLFGQLLSVKGAFVLALLLAAVFYKTNEGKKDE
uniref:LysM domain-containing protein n=1 Tax=Pyramimonas obovata TaxID=1411642 RepID=A0A7S0WXY6_9CHLO